MTEVKYQSHLCDDNMSFEDCELAILRDVIDKSDRRIRKRKAEDPSVSSIIAILESFLQNHRYNCMCYGGTAINNLLPEDKRFYDKTLDIPDYDFFSTNALETAKALADLYFEKGYKETEAKAAVHEGTYKVYVNFMPIADITSMNRRLFQVLYRNAVMINNIAYVPPNFLRMSMFLELSRPRDNVHRWEKVFKRMELLNEAYPIEHLSQGKCRKAMKITNTCSPEIKSAVLDVFIEEETVFLGGFALSLYKHFDMLSGNAFDMKEVGTLDVLAFDLKTLARKVGENLKEHRVVYRRHAAVDDIMAEHVEIQVDDIPVAFIYKPLSCHSYNRVEIGDKRVRVATIDTMMSFYLAFLYMDRPYMKAEQILCAAGFLFAIQRKNRLQQKGLLRRFSLSCYGTPVTMEEVRAKKNKMYNQIGHLKHTRKYETWFLQYRPANMIHHSNPTFHVMSRHRPRDKYVSSVHSASDVQNKSPQQKKNSFYKNKTKPPLFKDKTKPSLFKDKTKPPLFKDKTKPPLFKDKTKNNFYNHKTNKTNKTSKTQKRPQRWRRHKPWWTIRNR
jgi:hypothetical protein